jgi:cytochrome c553
MKRRYTVLALVAGVHATAGLIVLAQSQNASPAGAGANKGGTATPQGTGAGPFVTQFQSKSLEPDIQHGAVIAAQGTAAGAPACAQCHAYNGVSDASGAFPRIAGQSRSYLAKQLNDFASGVRNNALMTPIAKALNADDIRDVTAYYAGTNGPALPLKPPDPALVKRGEALAKIGSAEKQIQSCNNCHGPGGVGESPAIPYLAGQYSNYIAFTLREWRRGYRKNSSDQMAVVAHKLNDRDIAAVAAYYQQVASPVKVAELQPKE